MRKWTKSACVVVALGIAFLFVAVAGRGGSAHPAQASTSTASSTQAVPASAPAALMTVTAGPAAAGPPLTWAVRPGDTLSAIAAALGVRGGWQALYAANRRLIGPDPGLIRPGTVLALPGRGQPGRYAVAPGDTLSAIAAALGVRGGWPALYAANRRLIGPDPGLIRPGTVLAVPGPAAPGKTPGKAPGKAPAPAGTGTGGHTAPAPPPASPNGTASPAGMVPASPQAAGIMPRWLKGTLLAVGVLAVVSFLAQPAVAIGQRRRRAVRARAAERDRDRAVYDQGLAVYHRERAAHDRERVPYDPEGGQHAAEKAARIIQADHERLIVTYCVSDDTVYLLTPPGEDPRAVLRAARLILPEDTYQELAGHLGVPPGWKME